MEFFGRGTLSVFRKNQFKTDNTLGDYRRIFENHLTATDVKTKIMLFNFNSKPGSLRLESQGDGLWNM